MAVQWYTTSATYRLQESLQFSQEGLHNILTEFGIPRKSVGLIKMYLNETYSRVHIVKNLSFKFPFQNSLI
jgi:hypothetical protein